MIISKTHNELIDKILREIGININKKLENISDVKYKKINIYDTLENYEIDFELIYKLLPFLNIISELYDIDLPTKYPIGSIVEERKKFSKKLKSMIYCYLVSLFVPEIVYNPEDGFILSVPEIYIE